MSRPPKDWTVSSIAAAIVAGSVTLPRTKRAGPSAPSSRAAASPRSTSRSYTTTDAPASASPSAIARPSPWAAPVTIATRPSRRNIVGNCTAYLPLPESRIHRVDPRPIRWIENRLIGVAIAEDRGERLEQDLQVEEQRPVLDVKQVEAGTLLDRGLPAQAIHLRPAGHARLLLVPVRVARNRAGELLDEVGTLRAGTNQTHLTQQHIHELRQLVDGQATHERAESGGAEIVRLRHHGTGAGLRVDAHRAELHELERSPVQAQALLRVEDRAVRRGELDQERQQEQQRRGQEQQQRAGQDVGRPLQRPVPAAKRHVAHAEQRQAAQLAGRGLAGHDLEKVREDFDVYSLAGAEPDDLHDLLVREGGQGDQDFVDRLFAHD